MNFVAKFSGRALTKEQLRILHINEAKRANQALDKRLAARVKPRKLHVDLRTRLIETVMVILKEGCPTLFALEGTCRHHIRSFLCIEGWSWSEADLSSFEIVRTALNRLGAKRPSWSEGQPEYRGESFHGNMRRCLNPKCRGLLEEQQKLYCSDHCRHYVVVTRWSEQNREHKNASQIINRAKRKAANPEAFKARQQEYTRRQKEKRPVKECAHCRAPFKADATQRFCSHRCSKGSTKQTDAQKERACAVCFSRFFVRWSSDRTITCSRKCGAALRSYGPTSTTKTSNFNCEAVTPESDAA